MTLKFHGTPQDFQDRLLPLSLDGDWEQLANGVWKFKCRDRAGVLWSETKGTVWFDGPPTQKGYLQERVEGALLDGSAVPALIQKTV